MIDIYIQALIAGIAGGFTWFTLSRLLKKRLRKKITLKDEDLEKQLYELFIETNPLGFKPEVLEKQFGNNWLETSILHKTSFRWQADVIRAIMKDSEKE